MLTTKAQGAVMTNLDKANAAKLEKLLNKQYAWPDGSTSTLRDRIEKHYKGKITLYSHTQTHSRRKIDLHYRALAKPITTYSWGPRAEAFFFDIPKSVALYYAKKYNIPIG